MRANEIVMRLLVIDGSEVEAIRDNNIKYIKSLMLSLFKLKPGLRKSFKEALSLIILLFINKEVDEKSYAYYEEELYEFNIEPMDIASCSVYRLALEEDNELLSQLIGSFSQSLKAIPSLNINEAGAAIIAYLASYIILYRDIDNRDITLLDRLLVELMASSNKKKPYTKIKLLRTSASIKEDGSRQVLSIGAELLNKNKNAIALDVVVEITCRDSTGDIIGSVRDVIPSIDQGSGFYYGIELELGLEELDSYAVNIEATQFINVIPTLPRLSNLLKIKDLSLNEKNNSYTLEGSIQNPYEGMVSPAIYFVFYDSNDEIIGGYRLKGLKLFHGRIIKINEAIRDSGLAEVCSIKYSLAFNLTEINRRFR